MLKRLLACSVILAASLVITTPAHAGARTDTEVEVLPLDIFLPGCDNNVHVTGTFISVFHLTESPDGRLLLSSHGANRGIRGVDEDGDVYRFVYSSQSKSKIVDATNYSDTWVYRFRLIGTRGAPTYTVALVHHVRVRDGVLTTLVDRSTSYCK